MADRATPKPGILRRILTAIRGMFREQGDLNARRNAAQADRGRYGTGS